MPRCGRRRLGTLVMSWPSRWTEPLSGVSSPVMRLNRVVLPAPFGPMIRRRSPGSTLRLTSVVTRSPPNALQSLLMESAVIARPGASRSWLGLRAAGDDDAAPAAERAPALPPQPHGAGHQPLRHQNHDGDEDRAKQEIPALDVSAHHVLDDDDQRCPE